MCTTTYLETDRLILRSYAEPDRSAFVALNTDAQVRKHMDGPLNEQAAGRLFDQILNPDRAAKVLCLAVVEKESRQYIGHTFVGRDPEKDFELGFLLRAEYWGRGYATEAAMRLVEHCFDQLGLNRLVATVDVDHERSIRVLEKSGFRLEVTSSDRDGDYHRYVFE